MTNTRASAFNPTLRRMKTSASDPINVALLVSSDHGLPGTIGVTFAPGKVDLAGRWNRDLEADLTRLRSTFGIDVIVSLMEPWEYGFLGIADLGTRAEALGMTQILFPIEDRKAPGAGTEYAFIDLIRTIIALASAGKNVVIHCRGGRGRSGTVASSVLVARGHAPGNAIDEFRAARLTRTVRGPQEAWVHALAGRYGDDVRRSGLGDPGQAM